MSRRWFIPFVCSLAIIAWVAPAHAAPSAASWQSDSVYAGPVPFTSYAFHLGTIGIVYRGGDVMLIYGIDENSEGQLLLFITQPEVNAVQPYGLVATSADQSLAVVVWEDRNVTIAMGGPTNDGKVHYVTLQGGLGGPVVESDSRLGDAPGSEFASPSGTLSELQLGADVGGDDCVATPQSSFSQAATNSIYISAMVRNKPPGVTLQSIWSHSGDERVRFDYTPDFHIQENCIWFFLEPSDTEFTPGDWRVELRVNGAPSGALNFEITP